VNANDLVRRTLLDVAAAHSRLAEADTAPIVAAAEMVVTSLRDGGKLLVFGNGGSALDAQHVASELVNRFERTRVALAALALTTDTSVVTSIANDDSFERVFARQIEALGRRGDVALGISTSGESPNVVAGLQAARRAGLGTIALTGRDGGRLGVAADVHVNVPLASAARSQEVHRTLIHVLCDLVERAFAG
jgi:D-sedoheptulose 7-phosphate isomerase